MHTNSLHPRCQPVAMAVCVPEPAHSQTSRAAVANGSSPRQDTMQSNWKQRKNRQPFTSQQSTPGGAMALFVATSSTAIAPLANKVVSRAAIRLCVCIAISIQCTGFVGQQSKRLAALDPASSLCQMRCKSRQQPPAGRLYPEGRRAPALTPHAPEAVCAATTIRLAAARFCACC